MSLLSISADAKTSKGEEHGYLTGIQYLTPADLSGRELCAHRSPGCSEACLYTAGRGAFNNVQTARLRKTLMWLHERDLYWEELEKSIRSLERKSARQGLRPAVRLNGTSDILWERYEPFRELVKQFSGVRFYDYTKYPIDQRPDSSLPEGYDLTFSRSETNHAEAVESIRAGRRVAVVFDKPELIVGKEWCGYEVVDGDSTDLRFLDPPQVWVSLKAKGKAKKDKTGFVVHLKEMI